MDALPARLRLVIQRARDVHVVADGLARGGFAHGLVVYAGFGRQIQTAPSDDASLSHSVCDEASLALAARKVFDLRTFAEEAGATKDRMHLSVRDIRGGVALVSQFTLWADCRKGNRPGFQMATPPEAAKQSFHRLVDHFRSAAAQTPGVTCVTGVFGADMAISCINDGPVTYLFDVAQGQILSF